MPKNIEDPFCFHFDILTIYIFPYGAPVQKCLWQKPSVHTAILNKYLEKW